ncbi:hypothetical protein MOK15_00620 [Sphingobium sp. BYY-5]|uniref:hypothetical protein n=1 Tax=Sphingobium sp. BYY-5 TaxID=2926400 RepID=UPI001FA6CAE6|nr:hypothetical protein [Sphingobium sp. BYY-5]MCI4588612.1 hypothetical protein [Sphingobium sp. BYY-5]
MSADIVVLPTKPGYRIRLFLSVDLVGSTAFKSKESHNNLVWMKAFQKFYGRFPKIFRKRYEDFCASNPEIDEKEQSDLPKVWKTIGDEILFVNRVYSIAHLAAYVYAFREALIDFGEEIGSAFDLNTKGNAWVAAFPTPNRSIQLSLNGGDSLYGEGYDLLTEEVEIAVDEAPGKFDFLGKGIDGGFRISRNSAIDAMTLSPALAYLLCKAKRNVDTTKFDCKFSFHEPQVFKGVVGGRKYPVISLITSRDENHEAVECLEAELLDRPREAEIGTLFDYLESYIQAYRIEKPELKLAYRSADIEVPEYYKVYISAWEKDRVEIEARKKTEQEAANTSDGDLAAEFLGSDQTSVEDLLGAIEPGLTVLEAEPAVAESKAAAAD